MKRMSKAICCIGAALMMFSALPPNTVHAEDTFTCGAWVNISVTPECRTPMCDGTRLGLYVKYQRKKTCTYTNTGYTFEIPDTYVEDRGCC